MFYSSSELMALRAELAAKNINSDRLTVRYNPWDLGSRAKSCPQANVPRRARPAPVACARARFPIRKIFGTSPWHKQRGQAHEYMTSVPGRILALPGTVFCRPDGADGILGLTGDGGAQRLSASKKFGLDAALLDFVKSKKCSTPFGIKEVRTRSNHVLDSV